MEQKTLETIEYDRIREALADKAHSKLGAQRCRDLLPSTDIGQVERLQEDTRDALKLIIKHDNPPLYGIHDLSKIMKRLDLGGVLDNRQFMQISDSLRVSRSLKNYIKEYEEKNDDEDNRISELIKGLYSNLRVEEEINRIIVSEEEIADDASKNLFTIRRGIKQRTKDVRDRLNAIVKGSQNKLQENLITMRDGRYVVPVKAESRKFFPGIVHDQSASGQTLYIEPMAVVEINNEIRKLEIKEVEEINKILRDLSDLCNLYNEEIAGNQERLVEIDFNFAKGQLAYEMQAIKPILNDKNIINIKNARHPLLKGRVVPISIRLGKDYRALIITGPNTGGKTVTLKTLGLMTVMAQAGLHLPCDQFSELAVFENIFADIGDRQSIEMSLSTFSASMTNIVDILARADEKSLVLFDELGSGTDPTEGAALAMSIIDDLTQRGVLTVSTTHYSELKLYAISTDGVQNASVEFDVETLSPTYRLIIGTPGKSNAFEIARRLGLENNILAAANDYISKENVEFEDLISDIETDRIRLEERLEEVEKQKRDYEILNERLEDEISKHRQKKESEVEDAKAQALAILEEAKEESKKILKFAKSQTGYSDKELDRAYTMVHDEYKDLSEKYAKVKKKRINTKAPIDNLKLGETVKILSMDDQGVVQTLPDNNGDLTVQMGILKFTVNINDVVKVEEEKKEVKQKTNYRNILKNKASQDLSRDLDLRGMNVDESIGEIEKYLDDAILMGLKEVNIIHGKGTGALREGITEYLKRSRYVSKYRLGSLKEGGAGVTVVTLK